MKRIYFLSVPVVALAFGAATLTSAATFRAGSDYMLASGAAVSDNLYVAARTLTIGGTVAKDLIAAGGTVQMSGAVAEDATVAGGTVAVHGPVKGDLRAVAGEFICDGQVQGDFVVAAGTVHVWPDARIEGDTVIFGDRVILDGTFAKNVTVHARSVEVHGTIKGKLDVHVDESLSISDTAHIGTLTYSARNKAMISERADITGTTTFNQSTSSKHVSGSKVFMSFVGIFGFLGLLNLLLGSVLLVILFPRFCNAMVGRALGDSIRSVAIGFTVSIAVPVLAILFMFSIVGFMLGLLLLIGFFGFLVIGKLLAGILAGALLHQWRTKEIKVTWVWTLLGTFVIYLIGLVPILGWFVAAVVFFAVAGALAIWMYDVWWKARK